MCIIAVEDEPDDAFFLEYAVRKLPFNVTLRLLSTGEQAATFFAAAPREAPTLVLMDVNFPPGKGFELIQTARASGWDVVPFVMLTDSVRPSDREAARTAGASDYLTKPITAEVLLKIIERFLPKDERSE